MESANRAGVGRDRRLVDIQSRATPERALPMRKQRVKPERGSCRWRHQQQALTPSHLDDDLGFSAEVVVQVRRIQLRTENQRGQDEFVRIDETRQLEIRGQRRQPFIELGGPAEMDMVGASLRANTQLGLLNR